MTPAWPTRPTPPDLPVTEAHVWAASLEIGANVLAECESLLSAEERSRALALRNADLRRKYVVSHGALRILLGQYVGDRPQNLMFATAPDGKPQLCKRHDNPENESIRFNLAHSGELALVAVARGLEVGIDCERLREVNEFERLAERYFHPAETKELLAAPPAGRLLNFLRCWTAKEAVLKACGTGIGEALPLLHIPLAECFAGWVDLSDLPGPVSGSHCWVTRLSPAPDYVAAVAVLGVPMPVHCFTFPMMALAGT